MVVFGHSVEVLSIPLVKSVFSQNERMYRLYVTVKGNTRTLSGLMLKCVNTHFEKLKITPNKINHLSIPVRLFSTRAAIEELLT